MNKNTLACEKRDLATKAKKIRNDGFVPAVVYGPHIDSLNIQIEKVEAEKFLKSHSIGSTTNLKIGGKKQLVLVKKIQKDPLNSKILHMDFYAMTSSEKVKVTLPIYYQNRDSVGSDAYLQEQLSEIEISTLPKFLIEYVNVDLSKYSLGDSVHVSDLDISSDENIEVITSADSLVCTITHAPEFVEELPEDEAETEEDVEPTVINEKTEE